MEPWLKDLNSRFVYKADRNDEWTILSKPEGTLEGDCDDYALTVAWHMSSKSELKMIWNFLRGKFMLWNMTYNGEPHIALRSNKLWIDNIQKRWVETLPSSYKKRFPYLSVLALLIFAIKKL